MPCSVQVACDADRSACYRPAVRLQAGAAPVLLSLAQLLKPRASTAPPGGRHKAAGGGVPPDDEAGGGAGALQRAQARQDELLRQWAQQAPGAGEGQGGGAGGGGGGGGAAGVPWKRVASWQPCALGCLPSACCLAGQLPPTWLPAPSPSPFPALAAGGGPGEQQGGHGGHGVVGGGAGQEGEGAVGDGVAEAQEELWGVATGADEHGDEDPAPRLVRVGGEWLDREGLKGMSAVVLLA